MAEGTKRARGGRRAAAKGEDSSPEKIQLTPYEGRDVLSATVAVTNAGDGLSKAMSVEPVELHHGQRVQVVLDCIVTKVRYDKIEDTEGLQRVHIIKAGSAAFIDSDVVREVLEQQKVKIEAASGILHLPIGENAPEVAEGEGEGEEQTEPSDEAANGE